MILEAKIGYFLSQLNTIRDIFSYSKIVRSQPRFETGFLKDLIFIY